jgi:hypothetical protein
MANEEKSGVIVELHDLAITERKDDRSGRVVRTKSLKLDDLVKIAVSRRTDLNASTLRSSFELLCDVAEEQLSNGASVDFVLVHLSIGVDGVFIGDSAKWNSSINKLKVTASPTVRLREFVKGITAIVRGMASVGIVINTVTDVASGEQNVRITPGGAVNLTGSKMKVVGDNLSCGITLSNDMDGTVTFISSTAIAVNEPSKITFVVPATLPVGDYKLSITTQYSNSGTLLKEPRTYVFDYVLAV